MKEYLPIIIQSGLACFAWVFGRAAAKMKDLDKIKMDQILMAQSVKRLWEELEKIKASK